MKTLKELTDETLQAAIDGALHDVDTASKSLVSKRHYPKTWPEQAPARLALARAMLSRLPEPTPPVVDGKAPGQVSYNEEAAILKSQFDNADANLEQVKLLWKSKTEKAEAELARWMQKYGTLEVVYQQASSRIVDLNYQLSISKLPQLRPLSEAGDVPEGCVRWYCYLFADKWQVGCSQSSRDTHFADIRLPASSQSIVDADNYDMNDVRKPQPTTFEAHGKTWTKHDGGPMPCDGSKSVEVMLKAQLNDTDFIHPAKPAAFWNWGHMDRLSIIGWRYADEPASTVLIPLDASDIRATDEFRAIKGNSSILIATMWTEQAVFLYDRGRKLYSQLAANYLRRQHGSDEWKPCTKEARP